MSGSYRSLIVAVCGLTIAASLSIGAYVGSLYAPSHKQYQAVSAKQSAQQDYNGPSQSLPDIAAVPGPVERAIANPPPATGQDHEKRDLAAQEASAAWAFWMVLASYLSAIVTTVGTIFLYKQIKLTREAVEDTSKATKAMERQNDLAEAAQRAWVAISFEVESFTYYGNVLSISYAVHFKNVGQTIAESVWTKVRINDEGTEFNASLRTFREQWSQPQGPSTLALMPNETVTLQSLARFNINEMSWWGPGKELCNIVINAAVFYNLRGSPGFDNRKVTMRAVRFGHAKATDALKVMLSRLQLLQGGENAVVLSGTGENITT